MSGIIECRLAISAPERNSSDTMSETDILIIGGGIAGASTAYHLSEYGCDVTLLERGEIASEASGVNACDIGAYWLGQRSNFELPPHYGQPGDFQEPPAGPGSRY
jgi:choline dehydrogenase-like flavoprotein